MTEVSDATLLEGGDNSREKVQGSENLATSRSRVSQARDKADEMNHSQDDQESQIDKTYK